MSKETVYEEIAEFIADRWEDFIDDALESEYGEASITFAVDDLFSKWAYQTGDNSYTGACYSLPHRSTTCIYADSTPKEVFNEIKNQFENMEIGE